MAPLMRHDVKKRDSSPSKTFTIIFVLVVVFVAFICIFWGFILPKWQKRTPQRPSSTRFNGLGNWAAKYGRPLSLLPTDQSLNSINHPPRRFPAHPGVLARSDKVPPRPPGAVMVYNPRTETPFSNSPPTTELVSIPCITPRLSTSVGNLRSAESSRGPFSPSPTKRRPARDSAIMDGEDTEMTEYTLGARFGDAKEFILAVPEPLALKPRVAGRPPPLAKQLDKFPMPQSSSYSSSNEMHPNKLFAKLELSSDKLSSSDATNATRSERVRGSALSDVTSETSSIFIRDKFYDDSRQRLQVIQKKSLKSARGDFSTASAFHIHRAGTVTRPRTPVAEYRELYERAAAEARSQPFRSLSLKRELTPSTEPLTASPAPFSIVRSASTPPTSVKRPEKHLALLPTPLRPRRDEMSITSIPNMPCEKTSYTPSSMALPESPDKLGPLRKNVRSKRLHRKSIGFYHLGPKPRPAGLNIKNSFREISSQKLINRVSEVGKASMLAPTIPTKTVPARMSVGQVSSLYSRDTKGVSIVRTPVTSEFATPIRSDFQILHGAEETPRRRSLDLIRTKIDNWMYNLDPKDHAPSLKHTRTHSDTGPRSPSLAQGSDSYELESSSVGDLTDGPPSPKPPVPHVCVGSGSGNVFSDEHEAHNERPHTRGKERLRAEQSAFSTWTTSDSNLSSMMGRTAPGNAEWI